MLKLNTNQTKQTT